MDKSLENPETTKTSAEAAAHKTPPPPRYKNRKPWVILSVIVLLLALTASAGWWIYLYKYPHGVVSVRKPATSSTSTKVNGYQFYQSPQKLGDLNFFKDTSLFGETCGNPAHCTPSVTASDISYYQIGTTPSNQPIIVTADYAAGLGSFFYTALKDGADHYAILGTLASRLNPSIASDQDTISSLKNALSANVSLDTTTTIPALTFPDSLILNGRPLLLSSSAGEPSGYFIQGLAKIRGPYYGPAESVTTTKIAEDGPTTFYEVTLQDQPNYQIKRIYAAVGGVYAAPYAFENSIAGNDPADIIWDKSGAPNTSAYADATEGCGALGGYIVTKGLEKSQLLPVGIGHNQQAVYALPTDSALFKAYFANYNGGANLDKDSVKNWSAQQFQDNNGLIVAINPLGEQVVYERKDLLYPGGCGKPVVYLYPQQPTVVSVAVGAYVHQSNPLYGPLGWQHVLAQPDGKLIYQGQTYPSLYWEGTGIGSYPIVDFGTVVKQADVTTTIRTQLAQQGFIAPEINDFLAYWQPKLPQTPYVRLSWLTTTQMNELAPLDISPQPTTLIRAFLDFQGLTEPVTLRPQSLHAPQRSGFTVVEWGGLLRGQ